jgi:uncharacterized protein (TIGR02453 family)
MDILEARRFLFQLSVNNNREWFKANEARYEAAIRDPARVFIRAMAAPLEKITAHLVTDDRKVGGSLMRIQRDVRFSNNKLPYKTNVGIQFRHSAGKDVHAPGVYVHVGIDDVFVGAGLWMPEPDPLRRIRESVSERWEQWDKILKAKALKKFEQHRDTMARVPKGFDKEDPATEELKRRSFIAMHPLDAEGALDPKKVARLVADARDYMAFLCEAVGLPF